MDIITEILQEENLDLSFVGSDLFYSGVWYRSFSGVEMGNALVGLQRTLYEFTRSYLPAQCRMFWAWGNAFELLCDALLYETVS